MSDNTQLTLDCQGLACPEPVIRTRNAVNNGFTDLVVLVDNAPSSENVARFLGKCGFAVEVEKKSGALWAVSGHAACAACAGAEELIAAAGAPAVQEQRKTLVMLTTEFLGQGSDELGAKLMGNFLSTLPEMNGLWRIVMLNGGVRLAATPGKSLDALKKLAESGVGILVCGTCLEYYGLTEAKQVGETTNMLDIVASLDLADKVIRP